MSARGSGARGANPAASSSATRPPSLAPRMAVHRRQRLEIAQRAASIEEALPRELGVPLEHVRPSAGAIAVYNQRREPGSEQAVLIFTQLPVSRDPTGGV